MNNFEGYVCSFTNDYKTYGEAPINEGIALSKTVSDCVSESIRKMYSYRREFHVSIVIGERLGWDEKTASSS